MEIRELSGEVINGRRPKLDPAWPVRVVKLMERCWAAEPYKRPAMHTVTSALGSLLQLSEEDLFRPEKENRTSKQLNTEVQVTNPTLIFQQAANQALKKENYLRLPVIGSRSEKNIKVKRGSIAYAKFKTKAQLMPQFGSFTPQNNNPLSSSFPDNDDFVGSL